MSGAGADRQAGAFAAFGRALLEAAGAPRKSAGRHRPSAGAPTPWACNRTA